MSEPFIGEIKMFGGTFAPRGWAFCDGREIQVADNTALFSILGTTYGGDGRSTFHLPDLRGRAVVHPGRGAGPTSRQLGQRIDGAKEALLVTSVSAGRGLSSTETTANNTVFADTPQPTLAMNYIIALVGLYPSRS